MSIIEINESNFQEEVLNSDIPVIADLWAPWCGPCKALHPTVEAIAAEKAGEVKVVKINIDESPAIAGEYQVMSIPTLLFFKDGKVATQIIGLVGKDKILSKLESI
jgi:thioredoxin 1